MGFYVRKSISSGPFRLNLSRSGVGYSMGGRGFRAGLSARGRRYSTFSIPGAGIGYRTSSKAGCLVMLPMLIGIGLVCAVTARGVWRAWA